MEIPEISKDDLERLEEIRRLPRNVIVDAIKWWNDEAPEGVKRFIIVTTYYESILSTSEFADEALKEWEL